jgi:hypothetical protein
MSETTEATYSAEDYRRANEWYLRRIEEARRRVDALDFLPVAGETFAHVRIAPFLRRRFDRSVLVVTRTQAAAVRRVFSKILEGEDLELKSHDFSVVAGKLAVYATVGRVGDEGTAAKLFCRERIGVFVGPRGGFTAYGKGGRRYRGDRALIYGRH